MNVASVLAFGLFALLKILICYGKVYAENPGFVSKNFKSFQGHISRWLTVTDVISKSIN